MAKVVITRNNDLTFMGVPARVDINGRRVAELWRGETYAGLVDAGNVTLSADAWSTAGRFVVTAPLEAGHEYLFGIAPRGAHFATLMTGGLVGAAVEASVSEQSGPFDITIQGVR